MIALDDTCSGGTAVRGERCRVYTHRVLWVATVFYLLLTAAAFGLNAARGVPWVRLGDVGRRPTALALAVALALATVAFTRFADKRYAWAKRLSEQFRNVLGKLPMLSVIALALSSGIAEELFFRDALIPAFESMTGSVWLGALISTLAFGALHVMPGEGGFEPAWTIFALAMGAVMAALYVYSRGVLAPIVLHVLVNGINLREISRNASAVPASPADAVIGAGSPRGGS
ncbi:MAG: lysostaphin resistance A-like protein [Planctomycetota bacterium]